MRTKFVAIALSTMVIVVGVTAQATAQQIPFLPNLQPPSLRINDSDSRVGWVYLDGRRLFQIAAPKANLTERLQNTRRNLNQISQDYFQRPNAPLDVRFDPEPIPENTKSVKILVNEQYLVTLNEDDARLRRVSLKSAAEEIEQTLERDLRRAKQERETQFLIQQGKIAAGAVLVMIVLSGSVYYFQRRFGKCYVKPPTPTSPAAKPITAQLSQQEYQHITEVKKRLFQLTQSAIWGGGIFFILNLFPYTRVLQLGIITVVQIPLTVGVFAVGTYVAVRLSYALIDRFTSAFVSSAAILTKEASERLQLRVSTISGVSKSISTISCLIVGILSGLTALGIDIVPLLAGAGIVGVAISLASQSLIKDAINGFLIILEDQYALGDFITVGTVGGMVENLNLRMTQVRDAEGRLITIPNSEVKIVANLSSRWSRADLTIPIAYQSDVNHALKLIEKIGLEMDQDPQWEHQILETPQVLGIDNFTVADRGLLIRVWIKTQPLKQWAVAREFRRRLKIAFDEAGISIFMV